MPGILQLLGFPIQLVGLLLTPYFVVKYVLETEMQSLDAEKVVVGSSKLPALLVNNDRAGPCILVNAQTVCCVVHVPLSATDE